MEPKTEGNPSFQKSPRNITPPLATSVDGSNSMKRREQGRGINTDLPKGR